MKGPIMAQGHPAGGMASPQDWLNLLERRFGGLGSMLPGGGAITNAPQLPGLLDQTRRGGLMDLVPFQPPPMPDLPTTPPMISLPRPRPAPPPAWALDDWRYGK